MEENMQQPNNNMANESKGLSIASMVLGIISLVFFCFVYICIPCGLISIILGGVALATKKAGKGMAIAGLVCSIIGIAIYVICLLVGASLLASMGL